MQIGNGSNAVKRLKCYTSFVKSEMKKMPLEISSYHDETGEIVYIKLPKSYTQYMQAIIEQINKDMHKSISSTSDTSFGADGGVAIKCGHGYLPTSYEGIIFANIPVPFNLVYLIDGEQPDPVDRVLEEITKLQIMGYSVAFSTDKCIQICFPSDLDTRRVNEIASEILDLYAVRKYNPDEKYSQDKRDHITIKCDKPISAEEQVNLKRTILEEINKVVKSFTPPPPAENKNKSKSRLRRFI